MKLLTARRTGRQLLLLTLGFLLGSTAEAQLVFGLRGGVGFPTLRSTFIERSARTANIVGFHAGANVAYFFTSTPNLYLESGAQLALLGGASLNVAWFEPDNSRYNSRLQLYALQIPLRLGYIAPLGKLSLYVSAGLQPSVGLWGTLNQNVNGNQHALLVDFKEDLRRFNVAISFHTGVGFGKLPLFLGVYVDYGLIGILRASGEGHIGNFGVSLSFLFRRPNALSTDAPSYARVKRADDPQ